jgi:hypothetical protein
MTGLASMRAGDPRRLALDDELLGWMREPGWEPDEARFDDFARRLFRFQLEHCVPYARFCSARGVGPDSVASWREIPAVPSGAFKEAPLRCFSESLTRKVFRTSGTSAQQRGELHLDTLTLYEASLLPTIRRYLLPDLVDEKMTIRVLAPHPRQAPDSSLSHMFGCALVAFGSEASGFEPVESDEWIGDLVERLARARDEGEAIALCGTAFAFVHLIDTLERANAQIVLPSGSRIMETGGFKGRSRVVPQQELYAGLETHLGVSRSHIVNQYGMTELGSQFYDSNLRETTLSGEAPALAARRKLGPPWARARIVDPETGREADPGEVGMIVIHDLANTGSVAAIETADLGRRLARDGGFEVLGRAAGAEARGCSIAADTMFVEGRV